MSSYNINKGVDKEFEFKGLEGFFIYFFIFGLLFTALIEVILSMLSVSTIVMIIVGAILVLPIIYLSYNLNKRYGANGLLKLYSQRQIEKYISVDRSIKELLDIQKRYYEERKGKNR